jgi:hypothetical protein
VRLPTEVVALTAFKLYKCILHSVQTFSITMAEGGEGTRAGPLNLPTRQHPIRRYIFEPRARQIEADLSAIKSLLFTSQPPGFVDPLPAYHEGYTG